jgi:DNA polymerase III sliding clamp (beta) subunit (PCNA family)
MCPVSGVHSSFRLAVISLDYDDGEGQALINRDDLKGIANALKRAKRARVSFEPSGESLDGMSLIIDTELIRYKWASVNGDYPDWQKLIPTEFHIFASFDTVEAIKVVNSLKTLSEKPKDYPIDITIGDGKIVMANPDDKGQAELVADTDGEVKVRIDGQYLAQALKACGGMVEFKLVNAYSPMLFSANGYQLVVMPMLTTEADNQAKADREAKAQAEPQPTEQAEPAEQETTEPAAEKPKKARRSRAKEPVTA